jgi:archaellum component FlaC
MRDNDDKTIGNFKKIIENQDCKITGISDYLKSLDEVINTLQKNIQTLSKKI